LWLVAAIGVAASMGSVGIALTAALLGWLILGLLGHLEPHPLSTEEER
jgi:uncharacterized membrane protein YhiD involved in acid resistance